MAIPNPNPNIADGIKSDNKTYSSNKIESLISSATELPIPEAGDAGKVLTVNADEDGYVLTTPDPLPTTEALTIDYAITVTQGDVSAYRYGNVIVISGYFKIAADESSQVSIIELSDVTIPAEIFTATTSSAGTNLRLKLDTDGKLINESTIKGNEYYGFTVVVIVS